MYIPTPSYNMINFQNFNSLYSVTSYFNNEHICKQVIAESRWADGDIICPYCGNHHCITRKDGKYRCNHCLKNFSVTVGTIFENTKISLVKWFMAMYLISSHKKGISSHQLGRDLQISQKTAWFMLQKIRTLFAQNDADKFHGSIELDEVYIGGKEKWKHMSKRTPNTQGRSTKTKTPIFGIMEYATYIDKHGVECKTTYTHAFVVEATDGKTLLPIVEKYVERGSCVTTDELNSYSGLGDMGYYHRVVRHGSQEYVRDGVNTNAMEGFWSHFRRMIMGCYHDVSDKYIQRYINEAVYRWNTRNMDESQRFANMFNKSIGKCNYLQVKMTA